MKKAITYLAIILLNALILSGCGGGGGGGNSVAPEDTSKDITSFQISNIDPAPIVTLGPNTVAVIVPYGTVVTSLKTDISISGESISPASGEPQNFEDPVMYTVTAADGSTKIYTVIVTVALDSAKDIMTFTINGIDGDIKSDTIGITVPHGTDVKSLAPEIGITGVSVSPATGEAQDFEKPVMYTVTAADGSTKTYTVTVTVALDSAKDIMTFIINGKSGRIESDTIVITVPHGTDLKYLTPEIGITGESVSPASGVRQDFSTSPVVYTVTAFDGTTKEYTVSVEVESDVLVFSADGVSFNMVYVQGVSNFPTGISDWVKATVGSYRIGETEVTYELWNKVYTWAIEHNYRFANAGAMGGGDGQLTEQHPVTSISRRDAIVWTNALTEWYNVHKGTSYTPVYTYEGVVIQDSWDAIACDNAVAGAANGFRLLTGNEWELAARLRNDSQNTVAGYDHPWFTKGDSASGATANHLNAVATSAVAVYAPSGSTAAVKSKLPNSLGLYDMSGNVWEWCFDLIESNRVARGGSYVSEDEYLKLGRALFVAPNDPSESLKIGFRLALSE